MKLVEDWKKSWRWFCMQSFALATGLQLSYLGLPAQMQTLIPAPIVLKITIAILILGAIGRLVDQPNAK
jgi:hypothetical protein